MDPEAPGQQRLSSWDIQQTTADGCSVADGSSDLGETSSLRVVVGVEPNNHITFPFASSRKIILLQMRWQQVKLKKLDNEENRHLDLVR